MTIINLVTFFIDNLIEKKINKINRLLKLNNCLISWNL
jgi:hypothetical protein